MFRKIDSVVTRRVGSETIVVPIRNQVGDLDSVFTLNDVAERVWSLIDGANDVGAIVRRVCDEYDVEADVATTDVADLLDTFERAHLIVAA